MKFAHVLLACCVAWPAARAAGNDAGEHPLLDLARSLEARRNPSQRAHYDVPDLRPAEHALKQADAPEDEVCARTLGAPVFAELHRDLGQARAGRGDFPGAIEAYRRALACSPRDTGILGALASALFDSRDLAGARDVLNQALAIDPRGVFLTRTAGNIDFIEERWADAVARFRYAAASEPDGLRASYSQLMYWLAQMRAGVARPAYVPRRPPSEWPRPLMLYLQGQYSEAELVAAVQEGDSEYATPDLDERLCEALYYVGEAHWARGNPDLARDYFAATVNIRVVYFVEHGLALAEIAKLRP